MLTIDSAIENIINNTVNVPLNEALTRNDNTMLKLSFAPPWISQEEVKIKNFILTLNSKRSIAIKPSVEIIDKTLQSRYEN